MSKFDLSRIGDGIAAAIHGEFRQSGWTSNAIGFPISEAAQDVRLKRNGVSRERMPRTWGFAPNALVRDELEAAARLRTIAYVPIAER